MDRSEAEGWCDILARPYQTKWAGVVAAVATPEDAVYRSYGQVNALAGDAPGPDHFFELGSITKVFTALLLARMAAQGRLELGAPLSAVSSDFAGLPDWVTPLSLSTHVSGLPRVPKSLVKTARNDMTNPYAAFGEQHLFDWIASHQPKKPPKPDRPQYSNLGVGLLGYALGRLAGDGFEAALQREVLAPMGLDETVISLTPEAEARLATPHSSKGKETPPWEMGAMPGAGGLIATARDLVRFSRQVMAAPDGDGPMDAAIRMTLAPRVPPNPGKSGSQCLGWLRLAQKPGQADLYYHDGGTNGSSCALTISTENKISAFVLSNSGFGLRLMARLLWFNPKTVDNKLRSRLDLPTASNIHAYECGMSGLQ